MEPKKKRSLVEAAMHYHYIVILVTTLLIAFGIVGLAKMNKNEFPDFTIRQGIVVAVYPGASAEDVEQQVTKPLENYIFSYKEVKKAKTKSFSRNSMSIIQVELNDDLNDKDTFWSKFKHGIAQFKNQLPRGVLAVQVNDDFGDTSALLITLESKDKTYRELNDYMTALKDTLRKVESVGRMNVLGMQKEQISVKLDNQKLSQYGINETVVAAALMQKNFVTTAGTLRSNDRWQPIEVSRSMNAEADVAEMIVYSDAMGHVVRLKDIAEVRRQYPEPTSYITNNGVKCLVLSIEMKKGRNLTEMGKQIDRSLSNFEKTMPQSVKLFKITDQPHVVNASVWNFLKELLIAIIAVVLVVLLLMPLRIALVASSTIPITIFISLGLFYACGIELNTVTLAALIVTLGMIVDNSIVIIDSYVEMLGEGKPRWKASIESAQHFFPSIFSATLAISVTFFPFLITMTGDFKDFLLLFPWAITGVLLVSLAVAELVVPFLQFRFITADTARKHSPFLEKLQKYYDRLIDKCFARPKTTLAVGVGSVVVGILLMSQLPQRLMPTAERNQFAVEIYLPAGSSLKRTAAVADSLEHIIKKDPRVVSIASFKGLSSPRFQTGYAPQFADAAYAQFIVNTKSDKATVEVLEEMRPKYENAFPGAYVKFKQLAYGTDENPVEIRLTCDDWALLKHTADSLTGIFRRDPELRLVRTNCKEPLLYTDITLDEDVSNRLGANNLGVEMAMASRYNADGLTVGTVWDGDYDINIALKGRHAEQGTIDDVKDEQIPILGGMRTVPLRQIARVEPAWQDGQIPHLNGMRTITIMAEVAQGLNRTAVNDHVQKQMSHIVLPAGVSVSYGGEAESNAENMPTLVGALMIAVVMIFFILLVHFRQIGTALLLLVSLSLTLFGTAIGILVTGVDFSLTCFLGIISLMGILVRNAIIMYDYAEELRRDEGCTAHQAIYMSAKRRMRPIFLTSAAASMGVVPMIIGRSGLWMPMGAVICFGTLITMFFILTILPIAYWLLMSGTTSKRKRSLELEKL